jgi:hypothetical protein
MSDLYREAAAAAERAEERAERLQIKLDEQVALNGQLRRQLRESSSSAQQVASQLRLLQGAPGSSQLRRIASQRASWRLPSPWGPTNRRQG